MRTKALSHKTNDLPCGITQTWRMPSRELHRNRRPYLEYQVRWHDEAGKPRTKHFYVGVTPGPNLCALVLAKAIAFRQAYEERRVAEGSKLVENKREF